jgi:hypothetical protein
MGGGGVATKTDFDLVKAYSKAILKATNIYEQIAGGNTPKCVLTEILKYMLLGLHRLLGLFPMTNIALQGRGGVQRTPPTSPV